MLVGITRPLDDLRVQFQKERKLIVFSTALLEELLYFMIISRIRRVIIESKSTRNDLRFIPRSGIINNSFKIILF
jgi:hypothetical protein